MQGIAQQAAVLFAIQVDRLKYEGRARSVCLCRFARIAHKSLLKGVRSHGGVGQSTTFSEVDNYLPK
eukprot:1155470-Pelagomonas_calceolata.AAC.6